MEMIEQCKTCLRSFNAKSPICVECVDVAGSQYVGLNTVKDGGAILPNHLKRDAREKQIGGSHYFDLGVQPWAVIDTWPSEQRIGFFRGNALKYIMRAGNKEGNEALQDFKKALHYLEKLVYTLERNIQHGD